MTARKTLLLLLAAGYLASAHCRAACAGPFGGKRAVAADSGCHGGSGAPEREDACCESHVDAEARLPSEPPASAPDVLSRVVTVEPAVILPSARRLVYWRDHDPPDRPFDALASSSRAPRPPPFGA